MAINAVYHAPKGGEMNPVIGTKGLHAFRCIRLFVVVLLVAGFGVAQHDEGAKHDAQDAIAVALQGHGTASTNAPARQHDVDHTCSPVSVCVPILLTPGTGLRAAPVHLRHVTRSRGHQIDLWRARPASPIPIVPG